jgi:drug/metabolite transporter (DMT)-like permease
VGVLLLGEAFGTLHLVAFALSLAGLLLATWPERLSAGAGSRSR